MWCSPAPPVHRGPAAPLPFGRVLGLFLETMAFSLCLRLDESGTGPSVLSLPAAVPEEAFRVGWGAPCLTVFPSLLMFSA